MPRPGKVWDVKRSIPPTGLRRPVLARTRLKVLPARSPPCGRTTSRLPRHLRDHCLTQAHINPVVKIDVKVVKNDAKRADAFADPLSIPITAVTSWPKGRRRGRHGGTVLDNCPRCRHPIRPASPPIGAELSLALHGARPYPLGGLQHRLSLLLLELCAAGEFPRPWPWLSPSPTQGSFVRISAAVARRVCAGGPCRRAVHSGSGVEGRPHLLHRWAYSIDRPGGRGAADRLCVGHGDHGLRRAGIGPGVPPPAAARGLPHRHPGQPRRDRHVYPAFIPRHGPGGVGSRGRGGGLGPPLPAPAR